MTRFWARGLLAASVIGCGCRSLGPADETASIEEVQSALAGDFLQSGGQVVMEAEHFSTNTPQGGHTWDSESDGNASGGVALRSNPDNGAAVNTGYSTGSPRLELRVNFSSTGTHQVWVRGRAGGSVVGNSDSVHVGIDGVETASADRINAFTASFGWSRSTLDGVNATISVGSTGVHTINVWMREDGFVVDKVLLTTNASFTPTGTGPAGSAREGSTGSGGAGGGAGGAGGSAGAGGSGTLPYKDPSLPVAQRVADLLSRMTLDEKIGQMVQGEQGTTSTAQVQQL